MDKPLVSILIPCYNAEQWLAETLDSALNQTWGNLEIIFVDDGSTDGSLAIAKSYESKQVKVISQQNQGASSARNRGLQAANGDFIQYLDADDLLDSNKIELQIRLFEQGYNDCVISGQWGRFYLSAQDANFVNELVWQDMLPVEWLVCSWNGGGMMHPSAWLVPRTIAENAGLWNENLSLNDDGEYFCRVVLASNNVKFCSGAKSYYRSGSPNSLSSGRTRLHLDSAFKSFELVTSNLLAKENSQRTRHACATVFQRFAYSTYPDFPDIANMALERVEYFGGSDLKLRSSGIFNLLSDVLGWKTAKQIQSFIQLIKKRNLS